MKVLIAVDVHDRPERVIAAALPWVERTGARVDIAYADVSADWNPYVRDKHLREVLTKQMERIRGEYLEQLRALQNALPEGCRGDVMLLQGNAADELVGAAPRYDALLIGTHGRTGLGRLWLGSVAEKVVRKVPIPVIVLPLG